MTPFRSPTAFVASALALSLIFIAYHRPPRAYDAPVLTGGVVRGREGGELSRKSSFGSRLARVVVRLRGGEMDRDERVAKLKEKKEELSSLSFSEIRTEMRKKGIKYHDLLEKPDFIERLAEFELGFLDKSLIGRPYDEAPRNSRVSEVGDDEPDSKPEPAASKPTGGGDEMDAEELE
ncbi:hypothetical protein AAMO2058_001718300 [Amorphochlora amoebiformis]|uniref:SAP domain-containing protein n=1 Tax=Amorphochlora amoebiformis TaxID=1561963 RepID=A0A7S0DTE0_9EUKA|mmetsp:Transcript_7361/g.11414  ORF Transcript_7361/g.11414 Transcript_7361/m.11414 type:complete len:178 (+) Transcript_7361:36-569(+)